MYRFTPVDYTPPLLLLAHEAVKKKEKRKKKKKALLEIKIYSRAQRMLIFNHILRESGNPERISPLFPGDEVGGQSPSTLSQSLVPPR